MRRPLYALRRDQHIISRAHCALISAHNARRKDHDMQLFDAVCIAHRSHSTLLLAVYIRAAVPFDRWMQNWRWYTRKLPCALFVAFRLFRETVYRLETFPWAKKISILIYRIHSTLICAGFVYIYIYLLSCSTAADALHTQWTNRDLVCEIEKISQRAAYSRS